MCEPGLVEPGKPLRSCWHKSFEACKELSVKVLRGWFPRLRQPGSKESSRNGEHLAQSRVATWKATLPQVQEGSRAHSGLCQAVNSDFLESNRK